MHLEPYQKKKVNSPIDRNLKNDNDDELTHERQNFTGRYTGEKFLK